jgi:hypothetical protein
MATEMTYKIRKLLSESVNQIIAPSSAPDTMSFWHGGNLEEFNEVIAQKNGRYEYGPGLYLTTNYRTAVGYAKGRRKLHLVIVRKGVDLADAMIDMDEIKAFVNDFVIGKKRKEVLERVIEREESGKVPAYMFGNIVLNSDAIKATNTRHLRQFYIDNGIDYEMVNNPFGWGEMMMVLYNMNKIVDVKVVKPKDKIEVFDLPITWS